MRLYLVLVCFTLLIQVASAQENPNPTITVENAAQLSPLYTINEEFFMASFSLFEHEQTAILIVDSEYNESAKTYESTIRTWDLASQQVTNTIVFASNGAIYNPMQIPVSSRMATIGIGGTVVVQEYPSGRILREFDSTSLIHTYAAMSGNGRKLVHTQCIWKNDASVECYPETWFFMIYDTNSLELYSTIDIQLERLDVLNRYTVRGLDLSETGRYLLIEGTTELNIFDTSTSERVLLDEDSCRVHHASFIGETDILAVRQSCVDMSAPSVVEWNFETNAERRIFAYSDSEIMYMELSPDRSILGVLTSSTLYIVDFITGEILKEIESGTRDYSFDFSPDGRYLLLGNIIYGIESSQ